MRYYSTYLLLHSKRKSYRYGMTQRWENYDNITTHKDKHSNMNQVMIASNVKLCVLTYAFALGGLRRLNLCVCLIAYGVCSACSPAELMKCKQPKPRAAVTWSMLCCWERRRGEMFRGVCPFAFVCTCEPLGTTCTMECVWGWGAVQTEAGWWINHGAIARACRSRDAQSDCSSAKGKKKRSRRTERNVWKKRSQVWFKT